MYTVNDFFCGCGGLGLGFKQAGYGLSGRGTLISTPYKRTTQM